MPAFRTLIETILKGLRDGSLKVFAAVEYEDWTVKDSVPPEIGLQRDIVEIDEADVLVTLVHDKPSAGVQFEIGYAVAKGKQVIR